MLWRAARMAACRRRQPKGVQKRMTGAMYAAISGLKTHMNKLNVIGNNVANVNTYGYKAGTTTFTESIYVTSKSGAGGTATYGGTNPSQIGYGCSIGTIDLDMSTKSYSPTGNNMDSMIQGDGFYLVGAKGATDVSQLTLTRVGQFRFDADGYLCDINGNVVYGFPAALNEEPDSLASLDYSDDQNKYENAGNPAQTKGVSTQLMPIRLPLAHKGAGTDPTDVANYIKPGTSVYPWVDNGNTVYADDDPNNADNDLVTIDPVTGKAKCIGFDTVTISDTGMISVINSSTDENVVVGYLALGKAENPNGLAHTQGMYYRATDASGDIRVSTARGVISGNLNNQAATADNNVPTEDVITGGASYLVIGGLEASGTDVATEFSEMITTQRGYQANTRIVTVTDSMLEELVNMKR